MKRIRIVVADDSLTVRRYLCEVLGADPELEVVGEAEDGQGAVELCARLRPDVVTLDMTMPGTNGLEATERIMADHPTPILIVSASINRGELYRTYDALAAGAVDVLEKPSGDDDGWPARFLRTVKLVSRVRVITHIRGRIGLARASQAPAVAPLRVAEGARSLVAIGASTGGPGAIVDVLRGVPAPLRAPVLVVLHVGEPFGAALADWLDEQTDHSVSLARDGEPLEAVAGRVVMAPPGAHLVVRGARLQLSDAPERHSCRPSVDLLFESIASCPLAASAAACLLTGMGRDGAEGLAALRRAGALTIAQDEATSVVYGMPREAVLLGAAAQVLPLSEIGPAIARAVEGLR